jgi:hypothetical protein
MSRTSKLILGVQVLSIKPLSDPRMDSITIVCLILYIL